MSLRLLETAIYGSDLSAAERFYTEVLGLELHSKEPGRHVFLKCGPAMLLVFNPEETSRTSGQVPAHGSVGPGHVAFAVGDGEELAAWESKFGAAGIVTEADVSWPGGGRSLYIRDPSGNSVEFTTPAIWGLE